MRRASMAVAAICAAVSLIASAGHAAGPEPYRLEDALTLRTFSDLTWPRDGKRLA